MSAPLSSTVHTSRPEGVAEAIEQGFGYRVALSAGEMSYRQHLIVGDTVAVADLHLGAEFTIDLDPMDEFMFVELHAGTYRYDPWGSERFVEAGGSLVMPPGQAMRFTIDHADVSTCSFSSDLMHETARQVFDVDEVNLIEGAVAPVDAANAWLWHQTITGYRRGVLGTRDMHENDLVRRESARYLIVSAINGFGLVAAPIRKARGSAAVRRAVAYVDDHVQSPLTVQDIASAARLSERGLLQAFHRERGQSPMQYVRAARLAGAHAALVAGDPTRGDTVASVAAAWGFTNSSRFTKQYRSVYDESPRETLHR